MIKWLKAVSAKYYEEFCLMEQAFIKDPDKTIAHIAERKNRTIGENISIRRFVRFELGEGLEKKVDNFVEEVMAQIKHIIKHIELKLEHLCVPSFI